MDYQKMAAYRNKNNRFTKRLGIVVEEISPGAARVTKVIGEDDLNPLGIPHGGVYFSLADTAAGSAMASKGYQAVTMNASYNFLRSAYQGDTLIALAEEVKSGQTICVYDVRITNQGGTLLGTGTFTFFQLDKKLEF